MSIPPPPLLPSISTDSSVLLDARDYLDVSVFPLLLQGIEKMFESLKGKESGYDVVSGKVGSLAPLDWLALVSVFPKRGNLTRAPVSRTTQSPTTRITIAGFARPNFGNTKKDGRS